MQIVTYLGFTLLSVFIQFSVIDFIQGKLKVDDKPIDAKGVSQKKLLRDVLQDPNVSVKPHALYYRTQKNRGIIDSPAKFISNITLTEFLATTDMTTTVFDILYDENTTSTDESFTTESFYTTIDIENITEITFFEKLNETGKTDVVKKTTIEDCSCNFLLKVCDINCCCDKDCLDSETKLFPKCDKNTSETKQKADEEFCISQLSFFGYGNGLFCIVKVNLPEKRKSVIKKTEPVPTNHYFTWKDTERSSLLYEFSNTLYKYGDPIWLFKNGTIYHTDLPVPTVNSYCTGRKAMQFLKDERYKCNVKISDLEMFQITKYLEEVTVVSATPLSMNSSVLNCSSLHCVNSTIEVCKNLDCSNYSKSLHEPSCTESVCTNLAIKIEYFFYYNDFKISNATIRFHLANITMGLPLIPQEILVKFVVGNESIDRILKLSGNPGYLEGLPVIISNADKNYTDSFFNNTKQRQRYLTLPENKNGLCTLLNCSENFMLFSRNRRIHCRYNHKQIKGNATEQCKHIQNDLMIFLELNKGILVSPLGNPQQVKDEEWVVIKNSLYNGRLHGEIHDRSLKLLCFNLITRCSLKFGYAQIDGNYRILSVNYATTAKNASFNMDDISSVVTIDINFMDITRPNIFEYVTGHPSVNLHIPDDFFHPFRSNESRPFKSNMLISLLLFLTQFLQIK